MVDLKKRIVPITASVVAVFLGITVRWWLPRVLVFVGANSDLVQGLDALVQLVMLGIAGLVWLIRSWLEAKRPKSSKTSNEVGTEASVTSYDQSGGITALSVRAGDDSNRFEERCEQ